MALAQQRCCPKNQSAAIVTMRPRKDPWFSGGVTIHFVRNLPENRAEFELRPHEADDGESIRNNPEHPPKTVSLGKGESHKLPGGSVLKFLRFKGTRVLLAICYNSGDVACRAAKFA